MSSSESESGEDVEISDVEESVTQPTENVSAPDKSLYEEVLKRKESENILEAKECSQLTRNILSLQYARPDLDILHPTELEAELAGKNSLELRKIWINAQQKAGIYNPYALPTILLTGISAFVRPGGKKVPDRAYQDTNLLNCINDLLPDRLKNFNHVAHAIQVLCSSLLVDDVPENYSPYREPPKENGPTTTQSNSQQSNDVRPSPVPNVDSGQSPNGENN
jgi:hypothetical protein